MPEKFVVDGESVRGLAHLLEETGLTEIEYQVGTQRIRVVRASIQTPHVHYAPPPAASSAPSSPASAPSVSPQVEIAAPAPQGEVVASPMVGTVYLSGEPGSSPFVKVGDMVKKGDTLLIVEAMKVMNPIRSPSGWCQF
jgi:acetyl-CoA carboxylase biotin carboxyl carrier protein